MNGKTQSNKDRPLLLTVLCILTFIGSGLGILSSIWGLVPSTVESGMEAMKEALLGALDSGEFSETEYLKWTFNSNVAGLVGGFTCLAGALLMWNLRKIGYFIYVPGYLVSMVMSFLAFSHLSIASHSASGKVVLAANTAVMIAFFVLYYKNLKYLK